MLLQQVSVYANDSDLDAIKSDSKQLFSDIGKGAKKIGTKIGKSVNETVEDVKKKISKQCTGTWIFTNGKAVTTIVCTESGGMTLTQKEDSKNRSWKGTYEAASGKLTFKPESEKDVIWQISYSIDKTKMQLTSDDIPNDYNGFDFSHPAVFLKR